MTTSVSHASIGVPAAFWRRVLAGVVGGVAGGLVFGMLMAMMGMLPMIAGLVGSQSPVVGFVVHLVISAVIGAIYGLAVGNQPAAQQYGSALPVGLGYGVIWWILGPLVIMPVLMGMGPQFGMALSPMMLMSLMGHLLYGVITGAVYVWYTHR